MSSLFKDPMSVTVNIDNNKYPTSHFFISDKYVEVQKSCGNKELIWTDAPVTKNIAVNSKFLSGEVKLNLHPLTRDGYISDEAEFQKHAFLRPAEILEIIASLIRQGLVEKKKEGMPSICYVLYTKNAHVFFYNTVLSWNIYFSNKIDFLGKTQCPVSMYEIGTHCTVISLVK